VIFPASVAAAAPGAGHARRLDRLQRRLDSLAPSGHWCSASISLSFLIVGTHVSRDVGGDANFAAAMQR